MTPSCCRLGTQVVYSAEVIKEIKDASIFGGHAMNQYEYSTGEVLPEFSSEFGQGEYSPEFGSEFGESGHEFGNEFGQELFGETESGYETGYELSPEYLETGELGQETVFNETQEMELAAELLEVSSNEELDRFLGGLIGKVGGLLGRAVRSPVGRAIGGVLKQTARTALPNIGRAAASAISPGLGDLGAQAGQALGSIFGLELEGLSNEDREFEVARRFVRFAGSTAKRSLTAPPSRDPRRTARRAASQAARRFAPGLMSNLSGGSGFSSASNSQNGSSQWGAPSESGTSNQGAEQEPTVHTCGCGRNRTFRRGEKVVVINF